jgi:hypothetical protein
MPLTLIKEDGTGKPDANTYADAADGDAYHAGHLYASAWTAATADQKAVALVMATRLIDAEYQFNGVRSVDSQALQWPRVNCPDPDKTPVPFLTSLLLADPFVSASIVPKALVQATCEMARELLIADRTTAPVGEGLSYQNVGGNQTGYDKSDKRPVLSQLAQVMLAKYGSQISAKSGAVRLMRV